jgi:hypothetical protein
MLNEDREPSQLRDDETYLLAHLSNAPPDESLPGHGVGIVMSIPIECKAHSQPREGKYER